MEYIDLLKSQQGGFSFNLADRPLDASSHKFTKTGTTIVGVKCKDGVILGADTRATAGTIVEDKNCEKIDYMAPNIYCAGAGTAADTFHIKRNFLRFFCCWRLLIIRIKNLILKNLSLILIDFGFERLSFQKIFFIDLMASNLELMRLQTGRESRVSTVVARLSSMLHQHMGHLGAALIIGGYDFQGPQLVNISPHGK
jgi:20S proteasome subunit beta 2